MSRRDPDEPLSVKVVVYDLVRLSHARPCRVVAHLLSFPPLSQLPPSRLGSLLNFM